MRFMSPSNSSPVHSHSFGPTCLTNESFVGGTPNRVPFGSHWRTLLDPAPHGTIAIGTLYFAYIASPNAGMKLPLELLSCVPGCGSLAIRQVLPSKLTTWSPCGSCGSAP